MQSDKEDPLGQHATAIAHLVKQMRFLHHLRRSREHFPHIQEKHHYSPNQHKKHQRIPKEIPRHMFFFYETGAEEWPGMEQRTTD